MGAQVYSIEVPEHHEPYVTRKELAGIMGVSVWRVDMLRKAGMPYVRFGQRQPRFKPSVAIAWARANGTEITRC